MNADAPDAVRAGVAAGPVIPETSHQQDSAAAKLVQVAVLTIRSRRLPCALCGRPDAEGVGAFAPTNPRLRREVGTPRGKLRVFFYAVCSSCAEAAEVIAPRSVHVEMQREAAGRR